MKISKSFKAYIYLILVIFIPQSLNCDTKISNNIIVHKNPITILDVKFHDFELKTIDLREKKGSLIIINFWATWCLPCKREMPSLDLLAKKLPNITIYPINLEKVNRVKAEEFYNDLNIKNLKIFFDSELKLPYQFKIRGMPTSILINREGKEFGRIIGEIDFSDKNFIDFIRSYL
tara:strand:- start:176 stop:703 length:528 start_codon:yes stop_codon:yes gene_type:complete